MKKYFDILYQEMAKILSPNFRKVELLFKLTKKMIAKQVLTIIYNNSTSPIQTVFFIYVFVKCSQLSFYTASQPIPQRVFFHSIHKKHICSTLCIFCVIWFSFVSFKLMNTSFLMVYTMLLIINNVCVISRITWFHEPCFDFFYYGISDCFDLFFCDTNVVTLIAFKLSFEIYKRYNSDKI